MLLTTEQKIDLLLAQVEELKAMIAGRPAARKNTKNKRAETKEEITNRLIAKIRGAADAEKAE